MADGVIFAVADGRVGGLFPSCVGSPEGDPDGAARSEVRRWAAETWEARKYEIDGSEKICKSIAPETATREPSKWATRWIIAGIAPVVLLGVGRFVYGKLGAAH